MNDGFPYKRVSLELFCLDCNLSSGLVLTDTWNVKQAPCPGLESTVISPERRLVIFLQIDSPKPTPLGLRWALLCKVQKSLKSLLCSSLGIPTPVSFTETYNIPNLSESSFFVSPHN